MGEGRREGDGEWGRKGRREGGRGLFHSHIIIVPYSEGFAVCRQYQIRVVLE